MGARSHRIDPRQIALLVGGAAFLIWMLAKSDRTLLLSIAANLTVPGVTIALVLAALIHLIVAVRLRASSTALSALPMSRILAISLRQGLLILALPLRGGDFAYPFMLARLAGVTVGDAIVNLLLIRSADVLVIACLFAISLIAVSVDVTTSALGWILGTCLLLGTGAFYFVMHPLTHSVSRLALQFSGRKRRGPVRALYRLRRMTRVFTAERKAIVMLATAIRWSASVALLWTLMVLAGTSLSPAQTLFCIMSLLAFSLVPVQTIGGVGVGDGAFVTAMIAVGVPVPEAAAIAIAVRLAWVALLVLTALAMLRPVARGPSAGQAA